MHVVCAAWLFVYSSTGGAHAVMKESVALSQLFPVTGLIFVSRLNIVIAIVCSVLTIKSFRSNPGR